MSGSFNGILERFRNNAKSEREKGTYFEDLTKVYLLNDPLQAEQFDQAWSYAEWAASRGISAQDTGIDLVAKIKGQDEFCAIQCKFYKEGHRIQKSDLDSFFTASGKKPFSRRIIVDTTNAAWSEHAEGALDGQHIPTQRLGFSDLEQSPIDWNIYAAERKVVLSPKKKLRPDQTEALAAVREGFETADRGKMIMACGTGKTFTSLKIAEDLAGAGKRVLFLVPSLSLMSQTVREWSIDAEIPLRSFAVCSDVQVGKRRNGDDLGDLDIHDLAFPASTDAKSIALKAKPSVADHMTVVFSTYQSIQVISDAQKNHGLAEFDLIICDEAHRTTGVKFADEDESNFIKIHNQDFIKGKKRLYMTATPRIYGDAVKSKASEVSAELCSMDNEELYGQTLFQRGFSWAVQQGLLTDYKVIVLAVDESIVSAGVQKRLADSNSELVLDDATKIIGCYKALTKADLKADIATDVLPMKRALAFCRDIKSSKLIAKEFDAVIDEYLDMTANDLYAPKAPPLDCELDHVDGTFNAKARTRLLDWLKADTDANTCRILSNARCLSEGVDVPALDAILFLHPRKSQIDVVQSVGRVMRRAAGKKMGYVILPIGIPAGVEPEAALNNNEKYRVIWQILNALRAHDDRFDATINKMDLGADVSNHIEIIAVTNQLPDRKNNDGNSANIGQGGASRDDDERDPGSHKVPEQGSFVFDEISKAIMAKIVKKCGTRSYWEEWANDIAEIASTHVSRITGLLTDPASPESQAFDRFLGELRDDLNDSITKDEAIEMLAQHIITKPVFEALFEGYNFVKENPVSRAMQSVLDGLDEHNLEKESASLQKFYASVKMRAAGIDNAEGKQKIIVELYDKFFRNAFPKMSEKLGIVYTPVEVVDFIIHSVNDVLQSEFGQTLGSEGVHIIDPFVGTGTFITRLLQSGLIKPEELANKYAHEIHANEIVLLAYYIAAINIEAVYHSLSGGEFKPFEGICLTDTFQLYEKDDLASKLLVDNSGRRARQKKLDIRVIIGNPPYSAGQSSANDNNANVAYPHLDSRIRETYAAHSKATLKNALYDSYIRAIRWASDRIATSGVIGFVSNAGFIDANTADGLRKCLAEEFSSIYIFHLRGNARTSGELRRKEKDNVFGQGTRTPIAISILVKNPAAQEHGKIRLHDIGDYLSQADKLKKIISFSSIQGITTGNGWQQIVPDQHHDWIGQRDGSFDDFMPLASRASEPRPTIFTAQTIGVMTGRDAWAFNSSRSHIAANMANMVHTYNEEAGRFRKLSSEIEVPDITNTDPRKISWSSNLISYAQKGKKGTFLDEAIVQSIYRPYHKQWVYFDPMFNDRRGKLVDVFPDDNSGNVAIVVTGVGSKGDFSAYLVKSIFSRDMIEKGQGFPLKILEIDSGGSGNDLFSRNHNVNLGAFRDGIADGGLKQFQDAYKGEKITKEDLFYYVYGLLHSEDYRERYADNLSKELPRIPAVKTAKDFWAFSKAGRALGDLHVNYEAVEPYPVTFKEGALELSNFKDADYRVEKMKFGKANGDADKTTVIYNSKITITNIPLEAYDYVVNGKPALVWVMERQGVKTDKDSGIVNDANLYAIETMNDAAYPLKLFQRVITVSLETMRIVRALPALDI